jgi:hypothetical protein
MALLDEQVDRLVAGLRSAGDQVTKELNSVSQETLYTLRSMLNGATITVTIKLPAPQQNPDPGT